METFVQEVRLLRKLKHPNIVQFVGCGFKADSMHDDILDTNDFFLVLEFCAGGTLRSLVMEQMQLPFKKLYTNADALRWSLELARALNYLHSAYPKVCSGARTLSIRSRPCALCCCQHSTTDLQPPAAMSCGCSVDWASQDSAIRLPDSFVWQQLS